MKRVLYVVSQIVFNFVCLNRNVSFPPQFQAWHIGFAKKSKEVGS